MLFKWLIVGIVIYGVYVVYFKDKKIKNNNNNDKRKKDNEDTEEMVECCKCGTFVTTKEAFIKNGKFYCSKECMLKD